MKTKIVKTQKELDAIKKGFKGIIYIEGGTLESPIVYSVNYENAEVVTRGVAVINMWDNSQVHKMHDNSQVKYMYSTSQVHNMYSTSQVKYMHDNSHVHNMWDNSEVHNMWDNSGVHNMWDNSEVYNMWDNSEVYDMWDNSEVHKMWDNSEVHNMRDNSEVHNMRDNSQVVLYGKSFVSAYSAKSIICHGYNVVRLLGNRENIKTLVVNKDSHLIVIPPYKPTWADYCKRFPVNKIGRKILMYKAVHKKADGTFYSDYKHTFTYEIGKKYEIENDTQTNLTCSYGLHVSNKTWALAFGQQWGDMALIECEVKAKDIVVSEDCDGKVRTSKLTVIREVPKEEYENII